jgi:hypothetical protein
VDSSAVTVTIGSSGVVSARALAVGTSMKSGRQRRSGLGVLSFIGVISDCI